MPTLDLGVEGEKGRGESQRWGEEEEGRRHGRQRVEEALMRGFGGWRGGHLHWSGL